MIVPVILNFLCKEKSSQKEAQKGADRCVALVFRVEEMEEPADAQLKICSRPPIKICTTDLSDHFPLIFIDLFLSQFLHHFPFYCLLNFLAIASLVQAILDR